MLFFRNKKEIPDPPYDYAMLVNLDEKDYPEYLERMFYFQTGEELNLKHPKTFNQKIQWIKLYDNSPLKTRLTDKVLVRDWISNKIGDNYLKPVLWIGKNFKEIPFERLPNSMIIKCNHGCKWHFKIKDKERFLKINRIYEIVKEKFDGWMGQTFFPCAGFELQYKNIIPQIIIEPLLTEDENALLEYEVYCFNGEVKYIQCIRYKEKAEVAVFDNTFKITNLLFAPNYMQIKCEPKENMKKAAFLSQKLAEEFKLVRVDWIEYKGDIFFNEMTFTPMSGYFNFKENHWNLDLGNMLKL